MQPALSFTDYLTTGRNYLDEAAKNNYDPSKVDMALRHLHAAERLTQQETVDNEYIVDLMGVLADAYVYKLKVSPNKPNPSDQAVRGALHYLHQAADQSMHLHLQVWAQYRLAKLYLAMKDIPNAYKFLDLVARQNIETRMRMTALDCLIVLQAKYKDEQVVPTGINPLVIFTQATREAEQRICFCPECLAQSHSNEPAV